MAYEFALPDIGEGLAEAEIVRWLKAIGEEVAQDEPLVEVETDKAVVDIPSPVAGVVLHHGAAEGETCQVGAILAVIGERDEQWGTGGAVQPPPLVGTLSEEAEIVGSPPPKPADGPAPAPEPAAAVATAPAPDPKPNGAGGTRPQALPLVRRLAREHGVDLTLVKGSGPGGRIERSDVLALVHGGGSVRPTQQAPAATDRRERMSKLRRTIAERMVESWTTIPHVTTFDDVDAGRLLEARKALSRRHDTVLPLDALVVAAVTPVLAEFPEFNAVIDGDDILYHGAANVGVAVDAPEGLMVPVIKDAGSRTILELAAEIARLAEAATARSLTPDDLSGLTFTVSNIGAAGGGHGTPIIPPGTTAILSVGRAVDKPVVVDDQIVVRPMMPLSLSYDHRLVDGGLGRRFMARLIENLEEPALFLA